MCTAINYKTKNFYFGRTLDYYESYGEKILVTPRNYEFNFRKLGVLGNHYAIIGMGIFMIVKGQISLNQLKKDPKTDDSSLSSSTIIDETEKRPKI